jgi:hypothetical protein
MDARASLWGRAPYNTKRPTRGRPLNAAREPSGKRDMEDRENVPPFGKSVGLSCAKAAGLLVSAQSGGCAAS